MSLLKALANFKLPITYYYRLTNVPNNSKFVKAFATNLSKKQINFFFNWNSSNKVESSKYIQELWLAANNTVDQFGVYNLVFSIEDFKSLVVSAKHVKYLFIYSSWIPLDCKFDFGEQLNSCNIKYLNMNYCGDADNEDFAAHPQRFENLLEAISNSLPLRNSLETLYIAGCGVSREKAEQVSIKYGLNELSFTGV